VGWRRVGRRRTFFNTVLVRCLRVGVAGDTFNAFFEVVLDWSASLRLLAFCEKLAYASTFPFLHIIQNSLLNRSE